MNEVWKKSERGENSWAYNGASNSVKLDHFVFSSSPEDPSQGSGTGRSCGKSAPIERFISFSHQNWKNRRSAFFLTTSRASMPEITPLRPMALQQTGFY